MQTRTQDEIAQELAAAGEKWLDENEPGWDQKVSSDDLDMGSWRWCICGQVYGDFTYRPDEMPDPTTLGFDIPPHDLKIEADEYYHSLGRAWLSILASRKL